MNLAKAGLLTTSYHSKNHSWHWALGSSIN